MNPEQHNNSQPANSSSKRLLATWSGGVRAVWQQRLAWLMITAALPVWLVLVYLWTGIPLARAWQVALVALCGLALMAPVSYVLYRIFHGVDWSAATRDAVAWLALLPWAALGVWLPYKLLWWAFPLGSIAIEGIAAGVRLAIAGLLFTGGLFWLSAIWPSKDDAATSTAPPSESAQQT